MGDSIRAIESRTKGGFSGYHDRWVVESRVELTHRSRHDHRLICKTLALAAGSDALNLKQRMALE